MNKIFKNKYIWIFVIYLFMMTVVSRSIKFILYTLGVGHTENVAFEDYSMENRMIVIILHIVIQILILCYISILYWKVNSFSWKIPSLKWKDLLYAIYTFLGKLGIAIIGVIILGLLNGSLDIESVKPQNQQNIEASMQTSFLMIVPTVLIAPIVEEFFFRKILIGHMFSKHKYIGLSVSSLLFGSVHLLSGFSVVGLIMYSGLGFILGIIYLKTNRLEAPIIAHSFNNLISYLLILI